MWCFLIVRGRGALGERRKLRPRTRRLRRIRVRERKREKICAVKPRRADTRRRRSASKISSRVPKPVATRKRFGARPPGILRNVFFSFFSPCAPAHATHTCKHTIHAHIHTHTRGYICTQRVHTRSLPSTRPLRGTICVSVRNFSFSSSSHFYTYTALN